MNEKLNEKLYYAIREKQIDYDLVERLLKEGADPLGYFDDDETPIGLLFCEGSNDWGYKKYGMLSDRFPILINLFIKNGFDCSRFKQISDDDNCLEMWSLTFSISKGACEALQILIEHGLPIPPLEDFIEHFYMDSEMCDGSDMTPRYESYLVWAFKMIMMCASYPHILNNSEYLQQCIELDSTNKDNKYDLTRFRQYDDYEYHFDLSTIDNFPHGMRNATINVIEKKTKQEVWTMKI